MIREYNLPGEFAEDALEEARGEADRFEEAVVEGRLDLTGETTITIDPVDARDFDDAISLQRLENGHWRLSVHIADVSYFVRPGTALNREAYDRGTSTYLPDKVIPMLPEIISNALASLQPERIRLTKTAHIEFTADGAAWPARFTTRASAATGVSPTKRWTNIWTTARRGAGSSRRRSTTCWAPCTNWP